MVPGDLLDLSRWQLTLPVDEPATVDPPTLGTFELHPHFYVNDDDCAWLAAPVNSHPSPETSATELRQLGPDGQLAGWQLDGTDDHILSVTMLCDPSAVQGGHEAIVGQLHTADAAAVQLTVSHAGHPGTLLAVRDGQVLGGLLSGLRSDTLFTWRMVVTGLGAARRCYLYAGLGESTPLTPGYSWPVAEFAEPGQACHFRAGVRNVEPVTGLGRAIVRVKTLTVM